MLLIAGGSAALLALQTASIITAVPISIVMVLACVSLLRAFRYEVAKTPQYFEIVDGIDGIGGQPEADGNVPPMQEVSAASATLVGLGLESTADVASTNGNGAGPLVTVRSISPQYIEFDAQTGAAEVVPDAFGPNPLSDEVFDTPEFEESAQGAALARAAEQHEASDGSTEEPPASLGDPTVVP